jgi:hypothetical protein
LAGFVVGDDTVEDGFNISFSMFSADVGAVVALGDGRV